MNQTDCVVTNQKEIETCAHLVCQINKHCHFSNWASSSFVKLLKKNFQEHFKNITRKKDDDSDCCEHNKAHNCSFNARQANAQCRSCLRAYVSCSRQSININGNYWLQISSASIPSFSIQRGNSEWSLIGRMIKKSSQQGRAVGSESESANWMLMPGRADWSSNQDQDTGAEWSLTIGGCTDTALGQSDIGQSGASVSVLIHTFG